MSTEPRPQPPVEEPLSAPARSADPQAMHLDGCPNCVLNTEPPKATTPLDRGVRCGYLCTDCGHAWATDWRD